MVTEIMKVIVAFCSISMALMVPSRASDYVEVRGFLELSGERLPIPVLTTRSGKEGSMKLTREGNSFSDPSLELGTIVHCKATVLPKEEIEYEVRLIHRSGSTNSNGNPAVSSFVSREFSVAGTSESGKPVKVNCGDGASIELILAVKKREEIYKK